MDRAMYGMRRARRRRRNGRIAEELTACCTPGSSGVYRPVDEPGNIELQAVPLKSPLTAPPLPSVPIYTAPVPQNQKPENYRKKYIFDKKKLQTFAKFTYI